jgi:hypothetical protein
LSFLETSDTLLAALLVKQELSQHRHVQPERGHHPQQRQVRRQTPVVRERDEPAGVKSHLLLYVLTCTYYFRFYGIKYSIITFHCESP